MSRCPGVRVQWRGTLRFEERRAKRTTRQPQNKINFKKPGVWLARGTAAFRQNTTKAAFQVAT